MVFRSLHRWLKTRSLDVLSSIAFIPSLLAGGFLLLSFVTLYLDESSPERLISYKLAVDNLIHPDSARTLLGSIVGGMLSLMVFSFSMVMIVLNQAAANYSPRVLPGLISRRFHQVVMGTYLGTILYTIFVLSSIQSSLYTFQVPHLSILLTILFSLVSLAMFVAFVHSISQHIQAGNIVRNLYKDTLASLNHYLKHTKMIERDKIPSAQPWIPVDSSVSGYLHNMDRSTLLEICEKMDIIVWMSVPWGVYVHQNKAFFRVNRKLTDDEKQKLLHAFIFKTEEIISQNYAFGFKQLTEIALKAMSPGINDPGTAVEAINRLTSLFVRQMETHRVPVVTNKKEQLRWIGQPILFEDLFTWCWTAIKNYTAQDTVVIYKLIEWLEIMVHSDSSNRHQSLFSVALSELIDHMDRHVKSTLDRQNLDRRIRELILNSPKQALNEAVREKIATADMSET
ncbi:DUF2254 domain-containing protein [Tunicatimonas pelagia]|uniref:DUF2254 domain-containing protein n=1 Tax=Tunicatimonas pelagia TaxID=931531 RepID=UPI002665DCC0|nr:DUF2254 domain-containing protein [Tunicatimonas pelagia]WKN40585.1 DUF2254 domain-containing protein [Tunicatimonas pelagia]